MDDEFKLFEEFCAKGVSPRDAALLVLACSINYVGRKIRDLGNGDAATPMGAIENLAKEIKEGFSSLASSVEQR